MAQNAYPVRVVVDDENGLAAWLAGGSRGLVATRADGSDLRADKSTMFTAPRRQVEGAWTGSGVLRIAPAGRPWSVWVFPESGRAGWYINLEEPLRRTERAVVSTDHVLDVVVDGSGNIRLKDEDELAEAVRQGRFTVDQARRYRRNADDAIADFRCGAWPFTAQWLQWRPPPTWSALPLLADWAGLVVPTPAAGDAREDGSGSPGGHR